MTQEDINLLLQDLGCRLTYGVLIHIDETNEVEELYCLNIPQEALYTRNPNNHNISSLVPIEQAKPYLRPMSSMTLEERFEYNGLINYVADFSFELMSWKVYDWLNKHHFDYRGLIEKGLALEAPKGMYNIE